MQAVVAFWNVYGSILTGGAVIISAILAFWVIIVNRAVSRRRGTLDILLHIESDQDLLTARQAFTTLVAGTEKLDKHGNDENRTSEAAKSIRTVLNVHELVAVSIQEGVIDEAVFRRWFNRTYIDDYKATEGYIRNVRAARKNPAIFKEFECLAKRWESDESWYNPPGWYSRKWSAAKSVFKA